jgi:hypothetical protein
VISLGVIAALTFDVFCEVSDVGSVADPAVRVLVLALSRPSVRAPRLALQSGERLVIVLWPTRPPPGAFLS